jgi:hypothetical protein
MEKSMYGPVILDKERNRFGFANGEGQIVDYLVDMDGTLRDPDTEERLDLHLETVEQAHLNALRKSYGPPPAPNRG